MLHPACTSPSWCYACTRCDSPRQPLPRRRAGTVAGIMVAHACLCPFAATVYIHVHAMHDATRFLTDPTRVPRGTCTPSLRLHSACTVHVPAHMQALAATARAVRMRIYVLHEMAVLLGDASCSAAVNRASSGACTSRCLCLHVRRHCGRMRSPTHITPPAPLAYSMPYLAHTLVFGCCVCTLLHTRVLPLRVLHHVTDCGHQQLLHALYTHVNMQWW